MAPVHFTGPLNTKKKSDLQEIAIALRLSDEGTNKDLVSRLKEFLDENQATLEDDPRYSGLYARRKKSVQPQPVIQKRLIPTPENSFSNGEPSSIKTRRAAALDPITESTPISDVRNVSKFLKQPISTGSSSDSIDESSPRLDSPPSGPLQAMIQVPQSSLNAVVRRTRTLEKVSRNSTEMLLAFQFFLSNSRNIWHITAFCELLYIFAAIIPWKTLMMPILPFSIFYPPISIFQSSAIWIVVLHWVIPTVFIPAIVGKLISFIPPRTKSQTPQFAPFDPLTASIIRLAIQLAYPFGALQLSLGVQGLDVLGFRWRILSASVGLAFAFAEAIATAPKIFATALLQESRRSNAAHEDDSPSRKALMMEDIGEAE